MELTEKEKQYLTSAKACVLGTIGDDGLPLLTPMGCVVRDGYIYMATHDARKKYWNVKKRGPKVSVLIDTRGVFQGITMKGDTTILMGGEEYVRIGGIFEPSLRDRPSKDQGWDDRKKLYVFEGHPQGLIKFKPEWKVSWGIN